MCQFFFLIERKHCPYKNHEIKNGGHLTRFCDRAAGSAHQMHFLRFLREDWGEFQNVMYVKGGRKYLKNTDPFLQNLHPDSSFRTQCDKESVFK